MGRNSLYILICGFALSTLIFAFSFKSLTPDPWPLTPALSTLVESALQIRLFMQNEPNFRKSQMNVTILLTREYEQMDTWSSGKKQSQTNPNKAKFKKAKMNVTSYITKEYENKLPIRAPKKQSQTSKRQKPMQASLPQRIMKITALSAPDKTNPNKANYYYPKQPNLPNVPSTNYEQ